MPLTLIVTGNRHATMAEHYDLVAKVWSPAPIDFMVLGDAKGVDTLARIYAERNNIPHAIHKADWTTHGKAAGPIRNKAMLTDAKTRQDNGDTVILTAFTIGPISESRGTRNCLTQGQDDFGFACHLFRLDTRTQEF